VTIRRAAAASLVVFTAVALVRLGATSWQTPAEPPVDLRPTVHPPVPASAQEVWFAPAGNETTDPAIQRLQEGIRLHLQSDYETALPLLADEGWSRHPLGGYAAYYVGQAQLKLERYEEAQRTFVAVLATRPEGYLREAATLGAAEAAEAVDQSREALAYYESLASGRTLATEQVLLKIGQLALAVDDRRRAAEALLKVYYDYPLSEQAQQAATELKALEDVTARPGTPAMYRQDMERAERLFARARNGDARSAYLDLRARAQGDDRALVDLRLAACEVSLRRYHTARDRLRPYLERPGPAQPEVLFLYLRATRALGAHAEYMRRAQALVSAFPDSPWAEAALDSLGTHYLLINQEDRAADVFRELHARFPTGRYAERAAWKAGWRAYRHGDDVEAIRIFESAAAGFPRSDYRPSWLYWSGRSRERRGDAAGAVGRFRLAYADYGGTYFGRLAAEALKRLGHAPAAGAVRSVTSSPVPPTAPLIRQLVAAELYDLAASELDYARQAWGSSTALEATVALVVHRQGDLRRAITVMKRAYSQYLTEGSGNLPIEVQRIIFPLDYWPLIQEHSSQHGLDPHLVAALVAQESTFDASARSSANAYGLMQILPTTGRKLGRTIGLRSVTTRSLTDPEINIRLGTRHLANLLKRFKELHLALAAYNAGEHRVVRWLRERPSLPPDEFVDDIPFPETQGYVRRILGTMHDYRRLYRIE